MDYSWSLTEEGNRKAARICEKALELDLLLASGSIRTRSTLGRRCWCRRRPGVFADHLGSSDELSER